MYNNFLSFLIRIIRKRAGITQKQLAEKIGKSEILIRKYENGKTKITSETFFLIIFFSGLTKEMLLELVHFHKQKILNFMKIDDREFEELIEALKIDLNFIYSLENKQNKTTETMNIKVKLIDAIREYLTHSLKKISDSDDEIKNILLNRDVSNDIDGVIFEILSFSDFKLQEFLRFLKNTNN